MRPRPTHWLTVLGFLVALGWLPAPAEAETRSVNCDSGGNLQTEINSFANRSVANTLNIAGTCWGVFAVNGFSDLTMVGNNGVAVLQGATGECGAAPAVLSIRNSDRVILRNLTITDGGGVFIHDSGVVAAAAGSDTSDVTVTRSRSHGFTVGSAFASRGSSLTLTSSDVVADNCGSGVTVNGQSSVASQAEIYGNAGRGVSGYGGADIVLRPGSSIHDNGVGGVMLIGPGRLLIGGTTIYSNGGSSSPTGNPYRAGVTGLWGAFVQIVGNTTIENNVGPGILLRLNATGTFLTMTVRGNSESGMALMYSSVADLINTEGPAVLQNNGSGKTDDLSCDDTSYAFGDISLVDRNGCKKPK